MTPEVLAPGGSLDHALWALEGGADAVYVGFQKFSARSHADNLSLDDMAALAQAAHGRGSRVFCALNTILGSDEVAEAVALAWQLHFRGVDAFIVQDLGLARALKEFGPPVALHASTQAAVHNPGGVAALKALGFVRVVLARELTLAEIAAIAQAHPDMELEVFVHGALCYAVSGNCMASGMMIGRSANRGDCGQVCRTKFELDYLIPGPHRRESPHEEGVPEGVHAPPGEVTWKQGTSGAFASMNDLELGPRIRDLAAVGVRSFKIEGRMKPPAYAYNTARAYQAFLAGGRDAEAWAWLDEARLRFGRLPSAGWLDGHKALAQTNPGWAGSLGMPLGTLTGGSGTTLKVPVGPRAEVFRSLAKGDGVMVLGTGPGQTFRGALAGPAALHGTVADLTVAEAPAFSLAGASLWLLSRHDGKLPQKRAGKPWRHPLPLTLTARTLDATTARFTVSTEALGGLELSEVLGAEAAQGTKGLDVTLAEVFRASDSPFVPGDLQVEADALFVPPKVLKEFRRRWYALVEARAAEFVAALPDRVRAAAAGLADPRAAAPDRSSLSPTSGVNGRVGFAIDFEGLGASHLAQTPWGLALPLAPFVPGEESYFRRLRACLARLKDEGAGPVLLGVSNPCHLTWLGRLRDEGFDLPHWFGDWGFHAANPWTGTQLAEAAGGLAFAVPWLEDPASPDHSFFPPLFTSRACMLRNSFGDQGATLVPKSGTQGFDSRAWLQAQEAGKPLTRPEGGRRCPSGCAGHFAARLTQGKKAFRVEARDCINYLLLEEPAT